jgi:hypothetical protein
MSHYQHPVTSNTPSFNTRTMCKFIMLLVMWCVIGFIAGIAIFYEFNHDILNITNGTIDDVILNTLTLTIVILLFMIFVSDYCDSTFKRLDRSRRDFKYRTKTKNEKRFIKVFNICAVPCGSLIIAIVLLTYSLLYEFNFNIDYWKTLHS